MTEKDKTKKIVAKVFDYKDTKTLEKYINAYGQIESRSRTGLTETEQHSLARAIKRARHLALLPFVER